MINLEDNLLEIKPFAIRLDEFKQLFKMKPILVYPGKPTGRTIMNMIAEIPKTGNPVLYLTPDSPNIFEHAKFIFS